MIEASGNLNLLINRYFIHLASLIHPFSSCLENLYDIPTITAFFLPCADGGGPGGAWLYGEGWGGRYDGWTDWEWLAGGGAAARGSARWVMAWQIAHLIDVAPGGNCNSVWQLEQFTNIIIFVVLRVLNSEKFGGFWLWRFCWN